MILFREHIGQKRKYTMERKNTETYYEVEILKKNSEEIMRKYFDHSQELTSNLFGMTYK